MGISRKQALYNVCTRTLEQMKKQVCENKGLDTEEKIKIVADITSFDSKLKNRLLTKKQTLIAKHKEEKGNE